MHELTCVDTHTSSTPLIRLGKLSKETGCTVAVKAEFLNPGGSVKDRAALFLIKDAEERGTSALRVCALWCIYMHFHMYIILYTFFLSGLWLGGLLYIFFLSVFLKLVCT